MIWCRAALAIDVLTTSEILFLIKFNTKILQFDVDFSIKLDLNQNKPVVSIGHIFGEKNEKAEIQKVVWEKLSLGTFVCGPIPLFFLCSRFSFLHSL